MKALASPSLSASRELNRGQPISMDGDRRGSRLRCLSGQVWITQPGDAMDHLLAAGNDFIITRPGRVVVQALTHHALLAA
jgi:hypothetical protein